MMPPPLDAVDGGVVVGPLSPDGVPGVGHPLTVLGLVSQHCGLQSLKSTAWLLLLMHPEPSK